MAVVHEMYRRGFKPNKLWLDERHRGKRCEPYPQAFSEAGYDTDTVYPEHNEAYLQECLGNLAGKGVIIKGHWTDVSIQIQERRT
jgi:uncharacterized protein (TIGR02328 family)